MQVVFSFSIQGKKGRSNNNSIRLVEETVQEIADTMQPVTFPITTPYDLHRIYDGEWLCSFKYYPMAFGYVRLDIVLKPVDSNGDPTKDQKITSWSNSRTKCDFFIKGLIKLLREKKFKWELNLQFQGNYGESLGIIGYIPTRLGILGRVFDKRVDITLISTFAVALTLYVSGIKENNILYWPTDNDVTLSFFPLIVVIILTLFWGVFQISLSNNTIIYELKD